MSLHLLSYKDMLHLAIPIHSKRLIREDDFSSTDSVSKDLKLPQHKGCGQATVTFINLKENIHFPKMKEHFDTVSLLLCFVDE